MPERTTDAPDNRDSSDTTSLVDQLSLWPHQMKSLARMQEYISDFSKGKTEGSALVHMPTGSGKTGVIAALARCAPEAKCVLVLSPRIALRQQLAKDIRARFFERLASAPSLAQIPKEVVEVVGPFRELVYRRIEETVFVATIQKVQSMLRRDATKFEHLKRHVSLVLFDEGHYEPALMWSQAVRQLPAPKVIFTATPYRNDLKVFDLDLKYCYSYTYLQAVQDGYLREVDFIPRESIGNPEMFIEDVLDFYDGHFGRQEDPPRVIIRCEQRATIRQIATVLDQHGRAYVAIHERFSDTAGDPRERRTVPDPTTEDAIFWIHQFKLLEGIDDSRFQVLALYEPLRSARPLIQQIGRIIRNPGKIPSAKGYVLDHSGGLQAELWEGFLQYDAAISELGQEGLNLALGHTWLSRLLAAQPGPAYIGGRFRSRLDLDTLIPNNELFLPLRVNLLHKLEGFDLDHLCRILTQDYEDQDRLVRRYHGSEGTAILLYIAFTHSPFLRSTTFVEPKLGVTVIHELPDMIAFYDSLGYVPLNHDRARIGRAVEADALKKLFCDRTGSHLTSVSLRNTNLGARAIRSRSFSAAVVRETVSAFDDHAQVCTTARGYSTDDPSTPLHRTRRYVGFHRGRISQPSGEWCSLDEYLEWLYDVVAIITGRTRSLTTFRRYAPEEVTVRDLTPVHILLDLFEIEDNYVTLGSQLAMSGQAMRIEELSCEVVGGQFTLVANGVECPVQITYDQQRHRYELESYDLDRLYTNTTPYDNRGLVDYLNQEQSFRVIPKSKDSIYVLGQFYKPIFKVGARFNPDEFEVGKILAPCPALATAGSEKGETFPSDRSGWDPNSLFGIIDNLGASGGLAEYFGNPDIVVCDDMQTEVADFILADTSARRVVFIHAKASPTRKPFSASALQTVCAQATKNINYLGLFNEQNPPNLRSWDRAWPDNRNPKVERRIRRGTGTGSQVWSSLQSVIRHPLADREVWLFLGQTLSKGEFEDQLGRRNPAPEAVQAAFLLHATMTSVASVGAKLRVFCYP
jgi:superfamily II DNA or RNA helicase